MYALLLPVLVGIYNNSKLGNINIYVGNVLSLSMVLGGFLGSKITLSTKENDGITPKRLGVNIINYLWYNDTYQIMSTNITNKIELNIKLYFNSTIKNG